MPAPTNATIGDGLNTGGFQFDNPATIDAQQAMIRIDHNLNAGKSLFLRLNWDRSSATDFQNDADPRYPGAISGENLTRNLGFAAGWDWDLGPRKANELRVGYMKPSTSLNRDARAKGPMLLANSWTDPLDPSFPSSYSSPTIDVSDYFTLAKTNHTIKFGGSFGFRRQNLGDASGIYPNVTFGQNFGNAPPVSIGPSGNSVISAADRQTFVLLYNDLLGRMESVVQTFNSNLSSFLPAGTPRTRSFSFQQYSAFVQDDWRIRPNLMLNLGVRYELGRTPSETNGLQGALDQVSSITNTAHINGFTFVPGKSWYSKDLNNFAPRLGFAWDILRGKRRLVMRGGWGIYYDGLIGATTNFVDQNSQGLSQTVDVYPNQTGTDVRLRDGIPSPAPPSAPILKPPSTRSSPIAIFDPNLRSPYVQQFQLGLQKEIFADTVIDAAYVGMRGKRLFMDVNLNQTKIEGDFLQAFKQIQAYRNVGAPVPPSNTLVRLFGSTNAAISAIGGSTFDSGQVGLAADIVDRTYYTRYAAAGVSDFYLRNFPQFSDLIFGTNAGSSSYDSFQAGFRRSKAFYMVSAHYAWSKAFDNISTDGAEFISPADSFNPGSNKGPSDFDRRHIINAVGRLTIPFGKHQRYASDIPGLLDAIIGGWNLSGMGIWESGARFSVTSGLQTAQAGVATLADYSGSHEIGSVTRITTAVTWFSPDQILAFSTPTAGGRGTSGRNSFVGPRYVNLDVALYKNFHVKESKNLAFRGEIYNVLNRAHFGVPNSNLADPTTFGTITTTLGTPRIIQLALRLEF